MIFQKDGTALIARRNGETLRIEGWGRDALRVRAVRSGAWTGDDRALTEVPETAELAAGKHVFRLIAETGVWHFDEFALVRE